MAADHEVSVRDLRQNLSVHLRRVQEGQTLTVLNRGERVAVLAPIGPASRLDRLVAEGKVSPAAAPPGPWAPVALSRASAAPLSDALRALRNEDDR